jgi:hypothetical protein
MKLNESNKTPKELEAEGYVKSYDHYQHIFGKYTPQVNIVNERNDNKEVLLDILYNLSFDIVYLNKCYCTTEAGAKVDQKILKCAKKMFENCKKLKNKPTKRGILLLFFQYMQLVNYITTLGLFELGL